ncbi:hypothetical protein NQ176_g2069 [Zarea fungicola]|uniref:Uncharacterized protein n=1 Tax=Zarea fungicola TaxID=93591 RepID=A0ACC1NR19_9HYPO|nr:hypothetical protein NQ176_g2069 [Lecanicillium fungicola]
MAMEEREERKRELQKIELERLEERDYEQQKMTEVEEEFVLLQDTCSQGDHAPRLNPLAAPKYVQFYVEDEDGEYLEDQSSFDNSGPLNGHVYFDASNGCAFAPFAPPLLAGVTEHTVMSFDGEHELSFYFISDDYLILTVPQRLVLGDRSPLQSAPAIFEFVGIRHDSDKAIKEREELEEERKRRSPSPRETWFEMNHPMGAWNQGRWY